LRVDRALLFSIAAMQINRDDYVRLGTTHSIHVDTLPPPQRQMIESDPGLKELVGRDHVIRGNDFGRLYDRLAELDKRDAASGHASPIGRLSRSETLYRAASSPAGNVRDTLSTQGRPRQGIFGTQRPMSTGPIHAPALAQARGGRQNPVRTPALTYDTTNYALSAAHLPTAPADRARMKAQLDQRINQRFPGGYQLSGVQPGSDQELRAMQALAEYGSTTNSHNGTESDLLVPTGGAQMRMTVQTNPAGRASATVHAASGVPQPTRTFATIADAQRALRQDFGVNVVQRGQPNGGDSSFTLDELNQTYHAFSQLSTAERANLQGIDLVRSHTAPRRPTNGGDTTGEYNGNVETQNGARIKPPSITLYDVAFDHNNQAFVGNGTTDFPASLETILHETGHAIEGQPLNNALATFNGATDRMNAASGDLNQTIAGTNSALRGMDAADGNFVTRFNAGIRGGSLSRSQQNEAAAFLTASNRVVSALGAMNRATDSQQIAAARAQLATAIQARDRAYGALSANHPLRQAATDAKTAQDAAIGASNTTANARDIFFQRRTDRANAADAVRQLAQPGTFHVDSNPPSTPSSARLASFNAMRQRSGEQAVTPYGATGPQEAFAEAHMLFRTDPDYLRANRPQTFAWFNQGNHVH
jgi:hypothetical protein